MPSLKTYDIFISHAWRYGSDYEHLVNLLDSALFFNYRNYSAPKINPSITWILPMYPLKEKSSKQYNEKFALLILC